MLEGLHEEFLGIVEFCEVGRNFLEVLHEILLVVVLYEVGILYLLVHSNLLHIRSLHEVVRKLSPGLCEVVLHCSYWSDVRHFCFIFYALIFRLYMVYIYFRICFCVTFYFIGYLRKEKG